MRIYLTPDYYHVYNELARTYDLKGDDTNGVPDAVKTVALGPTDVYSIKTGVKIEKTLGQRYKARSDYRSDCKLNQHIRSTKEVLNGFLPSLAG